MPACAASIRPDATTTTPDASSIFYDSAYRVIALTDGSQLLMYRPDVPDGRPPSMQAFLVSASGHAQDHNFRLEQFIREEILPNTFGQIRGAAMSDDHQWIALTGGWASVRDQRGHNGVFVLQRDNMANWRLKSWFDLPGMGIGDIAFGPDDTLVVLTQQAKPEGGAGPILTLFSYAGQNLGSFISSPGHANIFDNSTFQSRLVRMANGDYAVYDSSASQVRFLNLKSASRHYSISQTKSVPARFAGGGSMVVFDPRPDGEVVFARSIVENRKGKTVITAVNGSGKVVDEWQAPSSWRYGYSDHGKLHGFSHTPEGKIQISTVSVQ
jgi:hypothetical protein